MGKIPIGRTIGEAFDFALGRYLSILGVIWLPILLLMAAQYFVLVPYFVRLFEFLQFAMQHAKDHPMPPPELQAMQPMMLSLDVVAYIASIWMQVGIAKTALGLRTGPLFVYVPVGLDELRVMGAYLVFLAILYGACIVVGIVGAIVAVVAYALVSGGALAISVTADMKPWLGGSLIAGIAVLVAALFYIQVRLTYLLVPATVSEKRFALWRSWELSKGNFWRIFTVGVGTLSPILVFEFALILAFYFMIILTVLTQVTGHRHGAVVRSPAAVAAFMTMLWRYVVVYGTLTAAIIIPLLPIAYGLRFSSSAFAYRALTDDKAA